MHEKPSCPDAICVEAFQEPYFASLFDGVDQAFPVGLEAIHAALAYYQVHRDEIDWIIARREQAARR